MKDWKRVSKASRDTACCVRRKGYQCIIPDYGCFSDVPWYVPTLRCL
ncbi:MAG: hypothetical protein IKB57_06370 [Bacteroidaceae bacterium]|nr:hypothetical protein [Bacteroidaceae bacterium]